MIALLLLAGLFQAPAEADVVTNVLRRHGWLWGPGIHAYNCCRMCPQNGMPLQYQPSVLPLEYSPEPVHGLPYFGQAMPRYPLGYSQMTAGTAQGGTMPAGVQPDPRPAVQVLPEAHGPHAPAGQPAATALRPTYSPSTRYPQ